MYAILPDDGTRAYNMGELWEVRQLRNALTALLDDGVHDGEIDHLHPQFGFKWLSSKEAQKLIREVKNEEVAISSITHACRNCLIGGAVRDGRDWRFPQARFLWWYSNRPKPRHKPAKTNE